MSWSVKNCQFSVENERVEDRIVRKLITKRYGEEMC